MTTTTQTRPVNSQNQIANTIRIYNTLSKEKEPLEPVEPGRVGIYLCGPTVYDKAHIGHMVGPVIFDCIKRYLEFSGYDVTWVVNITDVDDKLINKATERGITMAEVAEENTADYLENLAALGVDTIDHFPKATDNMDEIIAFTQSLIEKGFAYASRRRRLFRGGQRRAVRQTEQSQPGKHARRRGRYGLAQTGARRLRPLEKRQARRALVGQPLGRRTAPAGILNVRP